MSTDCVILGNPDISGIGVRIAIYVQNLLCLFLAILALRDGKVTQSKLAYAEVQTTTNLVLAFAILISSIVQARTLGMSSYHGNIVLMMSWMNNTNAFVYFILYIHRKHGLQKGKGGLDASWNSWIKHIAEKFTPGVKRSDCEDARVGLVPKSQVPSPDRNTPRMARVRIKRLALVLGSLHLTLMSMLGIWLWTDPLSFGVGNRHRDKFRDANECAVNAGLIAILGQRFPLHSSALRTTSLVIYTLFLVPGINLFVPVVVFLGMYVVWSQGGVAHWTTTSSESTLGPLHQRKPETRIFTSLRALVARARRWNTFPAFLGLGILLVVNIVLIVDIELTLHGNQALQDKEEAAWGFGQTLAILLLLLPLRDFVEALLARRFRQRQRELDADVQACVRKQDFGGALLALDRGGSFPGTGTPDYFAFWNLAVNHDAISEVNELRFSRMTFAERELDAKIFAAVQRQDFSAIVSAYAPSTDLATAIFHSAEAAAWMLENAIHDMNISIRNCCVGFAGSHVNQLGRTGQTPLIAASRLGDESFVRLLMANPEIDVNLPNHSAEFDATTPLIAALEGGQVEIARLLLDHPGIDPNAPNQAGDTPLIIAASTGCRDGLILLLQCSDVDVNLVDAKGRTALMHTSQCGNDAIAQILLERPDIQLNSMDESGATALILASRMGHSDIVLLLLQHPDTDMDRQDGDGRTAWDWALSKGHSSVLQGFLQCRDAYATTVDSRGYTPLMTAAELGHEAVTQMLLDRDDTQPNAVDGKGSAALSLASKEGREAVVRRLLKHSAVNVDLRDDSKRTAWDWAFHQGHASTLEVFIEHAVVDVNQVDSDGLTPLVRALKLGHIAVVRMLLGRRDIQLSGTYPSCTETSILPSKADLHRFMHAILKLPDADVNLEDLCGAVGAQSSTSAHLDGECDAWLSESSLAIEVAIHLLPAEEHPIAQVLAKGIYPRLSLLTLASTARSNQKHRDVLEALRVQCETSHLCDQIQYHHSVKNTLIGLLDQYSHGIEFRLIAGIVTAIDVQQAAVGVLKMPPSPEIHTRGLCVGQNGRREQDVVDVLHALLDIDTVDTLRPTFLRRLLHLSKVAGRFPNALLVEDVVVVESSTAMTSGASSDVWRGVLRDHPVAMKVLRTTRRPEDILQKYTKEAVIWSQLHHPNVLPFYGIYCFPHAGPHSGRMALLSPWLDAGNVVDYLRHRADVDKELLVLDIARGLHYLHSFQPAIVHGGLKRSNILINSAGRACLAGFGLSKPINSSPGDEVYSSGNLTAPELLFGELVQEDRPTSASRPVPSKTIESDVYAFGCVCFEIYMGKPRFWDYHIMARLLAVRNNDRCPKPSDMSDKLWESVEACWSTLPQNRPTMAQFIQSFAQGSGGNNDPESRSCDFRFKRVWDGRPNPRATFDFRQMSVGLQATDSPESGHSLPIPTVESLEAATPGLSFNEDDIIIAVMGPTGTGKSTFINDALSAAVAPVGHGVSACTTGINVYGCRHPVFSNRRVFLVDTPGFGVGNSDEKTLENLGRWLSDTYKSQISLSGVLYFMSIGEMRMNGRDLGNMNVFQKLCGSDAFKNVAIITTGWEEVDWAGAIERERSLKTEFLKDFLAGGGHIQRYRRVESIPRNAWDIVDRFDEDKRALLIQEEMVTKKLPFWGTSAFKAVRKFKAISKKRRNSTQEPSSNP